MVICTVMEVVMNWTSTLMILKNEVCFFKSKIEIKIKKTNSLFIYFSI